MLGAVVGQVSAVDLDSAPYNSFSYRLRDDDPDSVYFRVDGATGNIRTAVTLDRERRRMYRMSVIAQSDTVRVFLTAQQSLSLSRIFDFLQTCRTLTDSYTGASYPRHL